MAAGSSKKHATPPAAPAPAPAAAIKPKGQEFPSLEEAKEKAKDVAKTLVERKFKEPASLEDIK
jgi:hypothetical protein